MSRYDGLIIPRSYSEYINKTDAATLQQALQLSGVLSGAVAAGDNKAVTSNAVETALKKYNGNDKSINIPPNETVVTSIAVNAEATQRVGFLLMIEGNYSDGDATYCELYLIRVGYNGNHHTETLIHSNGNKGNNKHTFGVSDDGYLTISSNIQSRYYVF